METDWSPAQLALSEMQARFKGKSIAPMNRRSSENTLKREGLKLGTLKRYWSLEALYDGKSTDGQLLGEKND